MDTKNNLLVIHGGAPTAVMNASLYGVIKETAKYKEIGGVYGALGGSGGVLKQQFVPLHTASEKQVELLLQTPASAIGTSRDCLTAEDYKQMAKIIRENDIKYVLYNGGNGSMDACGKLASACGKETIVVGIPKTIDNDIAVTDHAPGFGSAARYLAATVQEVAADVRSLPIHVSVVESMGRNVGWLTAASVFAGQQEAFMPHMICLPEQPFVEDQFLERVNQLYKQHGGVVVVASEGLKYQDGTPIVKPIFQTGRSTYFGDVSSHLATLVIKKLGVKARSEKPGICSRASMAWQSSVDREEAELAGREAVKAALQNKSGIMVGFVRQQGAPYNIGIIHIPVEKVMLTEKEMPKEFYEADTYSVTDAFCNWCKPLLGEELREFSVL